MSRKGSQQGQPTLEDNSTNQVMITMLATIKDLIVSANNDKINNLEERLKAMEDKITHLESENARLQASNSSLSARFQPLELHRDSTEITLDNPRQEELLNSVLVSVPYDEKFENEDHMDSLINSINSLSADTNPIIDKTTIKKYQPIRNSRETQKTPPTHSKVKITFKTNAIKASFMRAKKIFKGHNIYANEQLTPLRQQILRQAKELCKSKTIWAAWTTNGKFYYKAKEDSRPTSFYSILDLTGHTQTCWTIITKE